MTKKILIVDDELDLVEIVEYMAHQAGFETVSASNGREAFEIAKQGGLTCILSDIKMPGGDGLELLQNVIDTMGGALPVFLMSGHMDLRCQDWKQRGATELLLKPLDFERLFHLIRVHAG